MKSSLKRALPEEIGEKTEAIILEKMRTKMRISCGMLVKVVRALEKKFGKEAVDQVARKALHETTPRPRREMGTPAFDLAKYVRKMDRGAAGTHEWKRKRGGPNSVAYEYSSCMWADIFKELGAADIGTWMCEGDDVSVRAYNPKLRCKTTRTLMKGDAICDHLFHVAGSGRR
jgi:hypothetical protein